MHRGICNQNHVHKSKENIDFKFFKFPGRADCYLPRSTRKFKEENFLIKRINLCYCHFSFFILTGFFINNGKIV